MNGRNPAELRELIGSVVNGEATAEQCVLLEHELLSSESSRDFYLDYINLHSELRRRFLAAGDTTTASLASDEVAEFRRAMTQELYSTPTWSRRKSWLWALAAIAAVLLVAFFWRPWPKDHANAVATIRFLEGEVTLITSQGTQTAAIGDALRVGDSLRVGGESSQALMQYPDGTTVHLHSGTVVKSPQDQVVRLELLTGSVEVEAARQSPDRPLVFATQQSRYVVLGTRFRLYQEQDSSRLELDEGKVRLESPTRGDTLDVEAGSVAISIDDMPVEVLPLSAGQAVLERTLPRAGQKVRFHGERLVTSHRETGLMIWNLDDVSLSGQYRRDAAQSDGLATTEDGRLVQINQRGEVLVWMPGEDDALKLPLGGKQARSRGLSPDGSAAAISSEEGTKVYQIDFESSALRESLHVPPTGKAWCLALTPQGKQLAAGFWDGTVNIYSVPGGEITFTRRLQHTPTHLGISPDGKKIIVATQRDGLLLIDLATGAQRGLSPAGANVVRCLCFSDDGQRVLAGLNDRTARMWKVADGEQLLVVEAGYSPQGIAWLEEKQLLATADGSVKLWRCTFAVAKHEEQP